MTDLAPIDSPALPSLVQRLAHDFAQKLLSMAAAGLLAHGVLTQTQSAQFVEVGEALALTAVSIGWTAVSAWIRSQREKHLLNTIPPLVGVGK